MIILFGWADITMDPIHCAFIYTGETFYVKMERYRVRVRNCFLLNENELLLLVIRIGTNNKSRGKIIIWFHLRDVFFI